MINIVLNKKKKNSKYVKQEDSYCVGCRKKKQKIKI